MVPSLLPELIHPRVVSDSEIESFTMRVWRSEQWPDALVGGGLSEAAREQGQRMVIHLGSCHPLCPSIERNGSIETPSRTVDLPRREEDNMQLGEAPIILGEHLLLGMMVRFNVRQLLWGGSMEFMD